MLTDPWFYAVAVPAVLLAGLGKGGFGTGAIASVPLLSLVLAPAEAAAIMLPILICMDAVGVGAYRNTFDRRVLLIMLPGAVVGIAIGGFAFGTLNEDLMRFVIGLIALAFVFDHVRSSRRSARGKPARRPPGTTFGVVSGALAGFTSTLAHAGGPPSQMYLLPLRLDKTIYVGTTIILFAVINLTKLVPYGLLGQLSPHNLSASLVLSPLAPLGMGMGIWLHKRIPTGLFYRLAYGLVAITGLKLVFDGLTGI